VLGPYGGTGGVPFDTGDLGHLSCYLGYISGRANRRVDQLMLHWTCPREEKQFSVLEAVHERGEMDGGGVRRVMADRMLFLVVCMGLSSVQTSYI
jgi:hypothetical protein